MAQLPPLQEGPSLENVRAPIEVADGFETWQIILAALAISLMAAALVWLYLRSKKPVEAPINPYTAACAELDAAAQAVDNERFAMLCANALRRFIAARLGLPATSQTTGELCARLPLAPKAQAHIGGFLKRCDGVKFAGTTLDPEQRAQILDTARELIEELNQQEETIPAP
ncbi:MAG: hypothetical protein ACNA77_01485 [Opitutales bacterium]